ncbi:c-type cytochrome [Marinibaculum pumilum]|uniref:C-type cytochrome n=1 Tax=Marinibaculum pumilum TaxID=1766165 RepID=A0ABV7KZ51_9PROT
MGRRTGIFGHVAAIAAAAAMVAASGGAMADVLAEREAGFKQNLKNMKAMAASLKAGEVKAMQAPAEEIAAYAAKIPDLFPAGSGEGDTEALPTIWQDWDDFTAKAKANGDAAMVLAKAAAGGDAAEAGAALKALGGTCGACHDKFRKE